MLDRTTPPPIQSVFDLSLPTAEVIYLRNNIQVHVLNLGTQDIVKVEAVFRAGRPFEDKKLVSRATGKMLKEGNGDLTGGQIAEKIDFYGGTLSIPVNLDTTNVILYSLRKHFHKLIPVMGNVLLSPSFPQDELDSFIQNTKQRLQIDLAKSDVVAYREVTEKIFGSGHPYGYNSSAAAYEDLRQADIIRHYQSRFTADNCTIFVSGKIDQEVLRLLDQHLGQIPRGKKMMPINFPVVPEKPKKIHVEQSDTVQTAIRIGRHLFNRNHSDYHGMYVLNTILGGYFGSRLMDNIREDKGYTYNIYSSLDTMMFDGYFYVGTEVSNNLAKPTCQEIFKEMQLLQDELVGLEELTMVRNYLLGTLLTTLDGPLNMINVIKDKVVDDLAGDHFAQMIQTIQTITPEQLQQLAKKYFNPADYWQLSVGSSPL